MLCRRAQLRIPRGRLRGIGRDAGRARSRRRGGFDRRASAAMGAGRAQPALARDACRGRHRRDPRHSARCASVDQIRSPRAQYVAAAAPFDRRGPGSRPGDREAGRTRRSLMGAGAPQPADHRRGEVRDDEPSLLPRPAPRRFHGAARAGHGAKGDALLLARRLAASGWSGTSGTSTPARRCGARRRPHTRTTRILPDVPRRIHSVVPEAKLIYLVRDPIDRIVAHWAQTREDGDRASLEEALADYERPDHRLVCASKYATQVEQYLEYFPAEQLLVLDMDELRREPPRDDRERFASSGSTRAFARPPSRAGSTPAATSAP